MEECKSHKMKQHQVLKIDLDVCGICGNVEEDEESRSWVECEYCSQWYHEDCFGVNVDTNDFYCSVQCEEKASKKSKKG